MAYDDVLAARLRALLADRGDVTERKMFGGLGFMVHGNMAVAASSSGDLMVRADPDQADDWIDGKSVRPMEMRGRAMRGWLLVDSATLEADDALQLWVDRGVEQAESLPPK